MIRINLPPAAKINRQQRYAAIKNVDPKPSFMQKPLPPTSSTEIRTRLPTMETASTCRRNPRISTVR